MNKQVKFGDLNIGDTFYHNERSQAFRTKIKGQQSGYLWPCPECGEPAATWINSATDGVPSSHYCPNQIVIVKDEQPAANPISAWDCFPNKKRKRTP